MALRWIEGFETFGVSTTSLTSGNTSMSAKYATISYGSGDTITTGRNSGGLCLKGTNGTSFIASGLNTNATYTIGFALKFDGAGSINTSLGSTIIEFIEGTTPIHLLFTLVATGTNVVMKAFRGTTATLLGTGSIVMTASNWYYIEIQVTIGSGTSGSIQTKINQVTDLNLTSINTQNGGTGVISSVFFSLIWTNNTNARYLDDIYICDNTGANNTTFLGDNIVEAISPTSAGSFSGWTPTSGANYTNVDEMPYTTADDVRTNTSSTQDTYNYTSLSRVNGNIKGIQVNSIVAKTDSTTQTIESLLYRSSTMMNGSTYAIPQTTYGNYASLFETDPIGSANWTTSTVNSTQFGLQRV